MNSKNCLNILKLFPMPQTNFYLFLRALIILLLLIAINLKPIASSAYATSPVDEIRTILAQRALRPPSANMLAALNNKNMEESLQAIDPYARYISSSHSLGISYQVEHLGIEVFIYKNKLWVRPDVGGPASQAGLPELCELLAINNRKIQGDNLSMISDMLDKAVKNGYVMLTVSTSPGGKGRIIKVMPTAFKPSSITWRRFKNVLVLRISEFVAHDTAPGLYAMFTTLVGPGTQVVLDLRGCSGGDLYEALEITGMFIPAGLPLAKTYDRDGVVKTYMSPPGQKLKSPIWVLIDNRTASVAEILAGILQYHHLARLVGERSYGKCLSQTLFPLSDGGSLWLTTLDVRFPDDKSCTGSGVKPDILYPDISVAKLTAITVKIANAIPVSH
ncbi:MAG: S41 family peptidase [Desulfobacterales bacterium]